MNDEWSLEEASQSVSAAFSKRLTATDQDEVTSILIVKPIRG